MKAVVTVEPAPGRSTRPPALEHVANRPILHHVLDALRHAEVSELIVAGEADALIDVRPSLAAYGAGFGSVAYAPCRSGLGLAATFEAILGLVGEEPWLLHPADGILEVLFHPLLDTASSLLPDLMLFEAGMASEGGDVALFGPGALRRLGLCTEVALADLRSAGERCVTHGGEVRVHAVEGWHRFRGCGSDLLELNRVTLDRIVGHIPADLRAGNRFEGAVWIDPTAQVHDSVVIGPSVIGAGAIVEQAYIGAYTSIGTGARVEGTEIERSIVADGGSVVHAGQRLVGSLIGRDAHVYRDFSLPRAHRLWLGDGCEIALN